ncbi:MAG: hypothetical protein GWN14_07415 [candidate division Zixibacteria bacterium]|nr:hypothetical protein [candidate division Zixibacteria bacterium]
MPTARYGMTAAVPNQKIYVMGGAEFGHNAIDIVEMYNPAQDSWQTNIAPLNFARSNAAAVAFEGKIYIFGGRDHNQFISAAEAYDTSANQWSVVSQMPTPREGIAAVAVDSAIWLIGGATSQMNSSKVERFYPHTGDWDTLAHSLNVARVGAVAAVVNNDVYVMGGYYFGPLNSYEKYLRGQGWTSVGSMLYGCGAASGAAYDNQIWIVGGENQSGILNNVQYFDANGSGIWNNGPPLQTERKNLAVARVGNTLYAIGGKRGHHAGSVTDVMEALDLVTGIDDSPPSTLPADIRLETNFPNPFNNSTLFDVYLPEVKEVRIGVINVLGQPVRTIYRGNLHGWQRFEFDARDDFGKILPSGNYFIYLQTARQERVINIQYLK